jgi:DNA-binding winged helix-turn-helix (wHTH) protein
LEILFHVNRQTLNDGNVERKLSFRETQLLKLLYENKDNIIDRKDILNLLWGMIHFSTAATLMFTLPRSAII